MSNEKEYNGDYEIGEIDWPPLTEEQQKQWDEIARSNTEAMEESMKNPSAYVNRKASYSDYPLPIED